MKRDKFYKSRAWYYFSRYMLLKYTNKAGVCRCATCGVFKEPNDKKLHLGHLVKVFNGNSSNFSTAFDEKNVAPQCYKCNVMMGGNELKMLDFLEDKHGKGNYDELRAKARKPFFHFNTAIDYIKEEYQTKFKEIVKEKGFNPWK